MTYAFFVLLSLLLVLIAIGGYLVTAITDLAAAVEAAVQTDSQAVERIAADKAQIAALTAQVADLEAQLAAFRGDAQALADAQAKLDASRAALQGALA